MGARDDDARNTQPETGARQNVPKPEEEGVPSVAAMLADAQLSLEQHYKTKIKDVAHIAVLSNVAVIGYD